MLLALCGYLLCNRTCLAGADQRPGPVYLARGLQGGPLLVRGKRHDETHEAVVQVTGEVAGEVTGEVTGEVRRLLQVLDLAPLTRAQAQSVLGLKGQANFRDRYLEPAL